MRVRDADGTERSLLTSLVDFRDRRVLEIGCGEGRLTRTYASDAAYVRAVDPEAAAIDSARAAMAPPDVSVEFVVAEATELELPPRDFDIVLFSWSL